MSHYELQGMYTSYYGYTWHSQYGPHGPVHVWIGGNVDCTVSDILLYEEKENNIFTLYHTRRWRAFISIGSIRYRVSIMDCMFWSSDTRVLIRQDGRHRCWYHMAIKHWLIPQRKRKVSGYTHMYIHSVNIFFLPQNEGRHQLLLYTRLLIVFIVELSICH